TGVSGAIAGAASGEPGWLARLQLSAAHALGGSGTAVAVILAVVSVAIGLGPLITRRTTVFLVAGAALSLDYWILGQSLGGIFTGMATDPNTGPLVVLLALTLFPSRVLDRRRPSTSVVEAPAGPGAAPSRRQLVGVG
ncbi:MAG TPA: hypothetical protein VKG43_11770, partial [Acidimicrobiales bacterium]|nr:hypothetical protein [Acidimicrobiales bacterium]